MRKKISEHRQTEIDSFEEAIKNLDPNDKNQLFSICKKYNELRKQYESRSLQSKFYTPEKINEIRKDFTDGLSWSKMEEKYAISRAGMKRYTKDLPPRNWDKLEDKDVINILKELSEGTPAIDIARKYKLHKGTIHKIQYGKTHKELYEKLKLEL